MRRVSMQPAGDRATGPRGTGVFIRFGRLVALGGLVACSSDGSPATRHVDAQVPDALIAHDAMTRLDAPGAKDAAADADGAAIADGSSTREVGTPGVPDLGTCGFSPTDKCPDFNGFQPIANGPYSSLAQSIANEPVDPNSAIMLGLAWYSPSTAPTGWDTNGQPPAASGGVYLAGYQAQHLWPQRDMPYQVLDAKTVVRESGPEKSSDFFVYGGTTAAVPYEYPWNANVPLEGTFGTPDDQRDLAQSLTPWMSTPEAPPAGWSLTPPGVGGTAAGTVANQFEIEDYLNGSIQGVRFYKVSGDTGNHVAYAWSTAGALLGTAPFANESASGWQYAWFTTPLAIAQFTQFAIGVSFSVGKWSATLGALGADYANGAGLVCPGATRAAPNGLTGTATDGTYPTVAAGDSYFWVDPIVTLDANRHALMYDRTANVSYETYGTYRTSSGITFSFDPSGGQTTTWRSGGGAGIFDFTHGPLHPFYGVGNSTAGGLPIVPLLLRYDELARAETSGAGGGPGDVGHAIRMTSEGIASMASPPARSFADIGSSDGMPYGARVRIKQSWLSAKTLDPLKTMTNYEYFGAHPQDQVILNTLAKYGAVMDDGGAMFQLSSSSEGADAWDVTGMGLLFDAVKGDAFEIAQIQPSYVLQGAATGEVGTPTSVTVALQPAGDVDSALYFWLTDGGDGTFSSNPVPLTPGQSSAKVRYTPASSGSKLLRAFATTDAEGKFLSGRYPPGGPAGLGTSLALMSLAASLTAGATTLTISATNNQYSSTAWNLPFWVIIDDEILQVTAVASGVTWTVTRAAQAFGGVSLATAHASGAKVGMASGGTASGSGNTLEFYPWVLGPALTMAVP